MAGGVCWWAEPGRAQNEANGPPPGAWRTGSGVRSTCPVSCGLMGTVIVDRESPAGSRLATTLEASSLVVSTYGGWGGKDNQTGPAVPTGRGSFGGSVPGLSPQGVGVTHGKILKWGFQVKRDGGKEMLNAGEIVRLQETKEKAIPPTCVCRKATQAACSVGLRGRREAGRRWGLCFGGAASIHSAYKCPRRLSALSEHSQLSAARRALPREHDFPPVGVVNTVTVSRGPLCCRLT